jgi:hydrogenase maturation factor
MNNEQQDVHETSHPINLWQQSGEAKGGQCELDAVGHCISCSDEALPATILQVRDGTGLALVEIQELTEEIDITLVGDVAPGDVVLVHGGVAISFLAPAGEQAAISQQEERHE